MKKKETVTREVTVTICDLCGNDERGCDVCDGCGRDVCYNCHVTMYPNPFGEDETGKTGLTVCKSCRPILEPYPERVREATDRHARQLRDLKNGWMLYCKETMK